jgi:hypothetical protein
MVVTPSLTGSLLFPASAWGPPRGLGGGGAGAFSGRRAIQGKAAVRELDATAHLALQDDQLTPERSILRFKSALRLEERGNKVQDEEYQRDHRC